MRHGGTERQEDKLIPEFSSGQEEGVGEKRRVRWVKSKEEESGV